jgi:hypothetical protein
LISVKLRRTQLANSCNLGRHSGEAFGYCLFTPIAAITPLLSS